MDEFCDPQQLIKPLDCVGVRTSPQPTSPTYRVNFHQRQLKVRETFHTYQLHQNPNQRSPIGEIHLKGHWLIEAGFEIDSPITVRIMHGCLVVTMAQKPEPSLSGFNQLKPNEQQVIKDILKEFLKLKNH